MTSEADTDALSRIAFEAVWTGVSLTLPGALDRTGWAQRRLRSAIDQLVRAGRIDLVGSDIVGAHGVTLRSTPHRILHDGLDTHTWCAFDAIGIPAALAIDARVLSTCPVCGRKLEVGIRAGVPADPPFLVWMPFGPRENVMRDFCSAANLFCSHEHVEDWRRTARIARGAPLTLTEIAAHGRRAWADVASSVDELEDRSGQGEGHGEN